MVSVAVLILTFSSGIIADEEEHKPDPWRNPIGRNHMALHLENEVVVVETPTIISNNPVVYNHSDPCVCVYIATLNTFRYKWNKTIITFSQQRPNKHTECKCIHFHTATLSSTKFQHRKQTDEWRVKVYFRNVLISPKLTDKTACSGTVIINITYR